MVGAHISSADNASSDHAPVIGRRTAILSRGWDSPALRRDVLLDQLPGPHRREPHRQYRYLVQPVGLGPRLRELLREPVALERLLVPEGGYLDEVLVVVLAAQERPVGRAVVERRSRRGPPCLAELLG